MLIEGGNSIKAAAAAIAVALVAVVPARAITSTHHAAAVRSDFLTIAGPKDLVPAAELRVPLRCSVECDATAWSTLRTPNDHIGPDKAKGHLRPRVARKLIIDLN